METLTIILGVVAFFYLFIYKNGPRIHKSSGRNFGSIFKAIDKEGLTLFLGVILIFLLINFNKELGIIFLFMLVLDWMIIQKRNIRYPIEIDTHRGRDLVLGVVAYGVFILISTVVVTTLQGITLTVTPLNSVFTKLSATAPVLSNSAFLSFLGWGVLIPIIETRFFFGRLLEVSGGLIKADYSLKNPKTWLLFSFISGVFMLFHLSAKAITNTTFDNPALIMTFIFGMISCILVVKTKELAAAVYLHITSNSLAVSLKLGFRSVASILGVPLPEGI